MFRSILLTLCATLAPLAAAAQNQRISHCIAIADAAPGIEYLHKASWSDPVPEQSVRLHYIDHSMVLLQTEGGLSVVTDFNGWTGGARFAPDYVTMNHAHSSHMTDMIPEGTVALKGWSGQFGVAAEHHLDLGEMLIRNVPTAIRSFGGVEENGNSIFVFEVAGLCIGHLGHLHHEPDPAQYAALGRLDVVMAAVDGSYTVDQPTMIRILNRLRSRIVIPVHWFGEPTLQRFLDGMKDEFAVERPGVSEVIVSLRTLPREPTVMVLEPERLQ
ncbi:MBL fold metallo-hydrolase [Thioclava sp. F28-4]|uniref:MBL fold metallo-hydrolase n=1 Tax=Thioclava sp. F28-4 TaxID=1915315 RepID=UPI0009987B06|nr:MBL fold metallo-hydrolase [Thioclava sp. F28-4]OOY06142.1 Zn-dependent hydrolase [Thioclava sp. F28-4]